MDVKTLCLGVLSSADKSGYEIKKEFEDSFRHFFLAGFGSIYPALAELTRKGLVSCRNVEQDGRPDKKVYSITDAGRQVLVEELVSTPPRHKVRSEFLVLMYFAHLIPADRLAEIIDEMIERFESLMKEDLADWDTEAGEPLTPGMRFALGYGRTVLTAALGYLHRQKGPFLREVMAAQGSAPARRDASAGDDAGASIAAE